VEHPFTPKLLHEVGRDEKSGKKDEKARKKDGVSEDHYPVCPSDDRCKPEQMRRTGSP